MSLKDLTINGQTVTPIEFEGQRLWNSVDLGKALGYGMEGTTLCSHIRSVWSDSMRNGRDYVLITRSQLAKSVEDKIVVGREARRPYLNVRGLLLLVMHCRRKRGIAELRDTVIDSLIKT